jgi:NitT/TauT family transport system substrate-binding protein
MSVQNLSRRSFVAAAGGAFLVPEAFAQSTANPRPVKVLSSLPTLTSAPTYVMKSRKFDIARGLDITIQQTGGSSTLQIEGLLSKNADFGFPGTGTALNAIREGADLRILGCYSNNQMATVVHNSKVKGLGVALDAPIADRMRALKGLTIATNPVGATYTQMLRYYLKQFGVDPDKDVRLVGVTDSMAMITGIQQGRFDAICTASGIVEQAISLGVGTLWFSGSRGDIPGSDKTQVGVMVTRGDLADKDPAYVEMMRSAINDSLSFLNNDRVAAGRLIHSEYLNKLDPANWDLVWGSAKAAYPGKLMFSRATYDFWIAADPKGAESYKDIDYKKITFPSAQG